eukprot:TRINITY_DN2771_c0_g2_i2.p1 TRINITY_DN2771_c0_g2~~TRINITY_DN2771_c0_g2_i2.p1  ORF type:complete len:615 (-),score=121.27 TRINITY_DN2771_c0_g2_i2:34-1878(-)
MEGGIACCRRSCDSRLRRSHTLLGGGRMFPSLASPSSSSITSSMGGDVLAEPAWIESSNHFRASLLPSLVAVTGLGLWATSTVAQADSRQESQDSCETPVKALETEATAAPSGLGGGTSGGQKTGEPSKEGEVVSNAHTAKWRVYTDRGRDNYTEGNLEGAERYFLRAVEEAKEGFGPDDPHVASACNNLAEVYRVQKKYAQAEPLYLEAVERLKASMGPQSQSVGFALHNLAAVYLVQRQFDKARTCYEDALKVKEGALGMTHPEYANTLFHLGEVLRLQGNAREAEAAMTKSLKILEDIGAGHTTTAIRRTGRLAEVLLANGRLEEAERAYRKLLHVVEMVKGPSSVAAISAMDSLAAVLLARGNFEEACSLLQSCLDLRKSFMPSNHPEVGESLFKLGTVKAHLTNKRLTQGQLAPADADEEYDNAIVLLERAMRIAEDQWGKSRKGLEPVRVRETQGDGSKRNESSPTAQVAKAPLLMLLCPVLAQTLIVSGKLKEKLASSEGEVLQVTLQADGEAAKLRAEELCQRFLSAFEELSGGNNATMRIEVKEAKLICLNVLIKLSEERMQTKDLGTGSGVDEKGREVKDVNTEELVSLRRLVEEMEKELQSHS